MKHTIEIPIRTISWLNIRGSFWRHQKRKKAEKSAMYIAWRTEFGGHPPQPPLRVTFTRVAPRSLDAGDNLESAFKYIRDELAQCMGLKNDAGTEVEWKSQQRKGGSKEYTVIVEIEELGEK